MWATSIVAAIVLYFPNNTDTMIATKALRDAGVETKLLPLTANVPSSAQLCLRIDGSAEACALRAIGLAQIGLGGIVR
jgi:hypothetical protein